jgi:uncharacterized protein (TIGR00251 family)
VREANGGITLRIRVKPRASREGVEGAREGVLVVRLTAPPVEGEANAALVRLLGRTLDVAPSSVRILRGTSSRDKLVAVAGVNASAARARLAAALGETRG